MRDDLQERERVVLLPCPFCGKEMSVSKSGMATHLGQSQDACIIGTMGIPTDHPPSVDKWNTRADAALAEIGGARVRELEWEKSIGGDSLRSYPESDGSAYAIIQEANRLAVRYGPHLIKVCDEWSDAKAAAQADYKARTLAAILALIHTAEEQSE